MDKVYSDTNRTKVLDTNVTMTNAYQALGKVINTKGLDNIALWLKGSKNDSDVVRFRVACYADEVDAEAGANPFYAQIQTIGTQIVSLEAEEYETSSANIALVTPLGFSTLVPYIKIEAKVVTAGATPAVIDNALISFDRR